MYSVAANDTTKSRAIETPDLTGADLSINLNESTLAIPARGRRNNVTIVMYALGIAAVAITSFGQTRRKAKSASNDSRAILKTAAANVIASANDRDLAELTRALRELLTLVDTPHRGNLENLLANLETQIYSPHSMDGKVAPSLADSAIEIAKAILR